MSDTFRVARDFLLANRTAYDVAYKGFQWPKFERFNWAVDWFDAIAAGERRDQLALWVVFEDGTETRLTFCELSNILPATPLLSRDDLADRIQRGGVRHIVCAADCVSKFERVEQRCTRIVVGGPVREWQTYEDGYSASGKFKSEGETLASDLM